LDPLNPSATLTPPFSSPLLDFPPAVQPQAGP
jgi:hypothetical protein